MLLVSTCIARAFAAGGDARERDEFAAAVARQHGLSEARLRRILREARVQPAILRAMAQPSTAQPWYRYRAVVVDERRIDTGARFWREHAAVLERVSAAYQVPSELIVATAGVETFYGRNTGRFRVVDALVTLAFHYPPRAELFRAELEEFLLLAAEEKWDPLAIRGSYAGAMGIAQFLPSSYRKYAVDFDGDGRRDLWTVPDALASIARYYQAFGWERRDEPLTASVEVEGTEFRALLDQGLKPHVSAARLRALGASTMPPLADDTLLALIEIETDAGPRYLAGLQNFYVVTRYNRSVNYALAVIELAREISRRCPSPVQ